MPDQPIILSRRGRQLSRIEDRPNPADWGDDDILTIEEAAKLFFPRGPLSERSLRHAVAAGQLATVRIANKLFTSPGAVRAMIRPAPRDPPARPVAAAPPVAQGRTPNGDPPAKAGRPGRLTGHAKVLAALARSQPRR